MLRSYMDYCVGGGMNPRYNNNNCFYVSNILNHTSLVFMISLIWFNDSIGDKLSLYDEMFIGCDINL